MTNINVLTKGTILPLNQPINDVIEGLLSSKHKASTRHTYRQNLKYFAHYLTNGIVIKGQRILVTDNVVKSTIKEFLGMDRLVALAYLSQYQNDLIEANYVPNTINIRIASIRSLVKFAFKRGFCDWLIEDDLQSMGNEVYRDTSGVNKDVFSQVISEINPDTLAGKRDYAIMRLLWDCGLRRSEVTNLNVNDFSYNSRTLTIMGKGRLSQDTIHLSVKTCDAIQQWLNYHRSNGANTPLFVSLANNSRGHRLTGKSIYCTVRKYADPILVDKILSPHRVRHSSITAVLDASNGNVRMAQKLSRHKNLDVLTKYDDNRVELQKEAVNLLADLV